jgi:futalosine hydrolase
MSLALVAATGNELKAVLKGLGAQTPPPPQGEWTRARLCGRETLLLVTGIGPINAAWALGRLLGSEKDVAGALNVGVAGSFDLERRPLCSAALVEREIWPEYGLWGEEGLDPRGLKFCLAKGPEGAVWDRLELAPEVMAQRLGLCLFPGLARASSLTVSGVTGTAARSQALRARYAVELENMEGFALALGCAQLGVPFVELRTVSNRVGARPPQDWKLAEALVELGRAAAGLLAEGQPRSR